MPAAGELARSGGKRLGPGGGQLRSAGLPTQGVGDGVAGGFFDPELGACQGQLRFLNELVDELRQPIDTARSNLDYVPTQVFCEYFLHVFDPEAEADVEAKAKVRGLVWTSAAASAGGGCLALNAAQEDCVDVADGTTDRLQLHLVPGSVTVHRRRTDEFRQV